MGLRPFSATASPQRGRGSGARAGADRAAPPLPRQPRRHFSEEELEALASSVRENGVLQPLLSGRPEALPGYEIIGGERRWRARSWAGLSRGAVVVRELGDRAALELALVETSSAPTSTR